MACRIHLADAISLSASPLNPTLMCLVIRLEVEVKDTAIAKTPLIAGMLMTTGSIYTLFAYGDV